MKSKKSKTRVYLPVRDNVQSTHKGDPLTYYFHPVVGFMFRKRLDLGISLIPDKKCERLLEIGYGSGILLPELYKHCHELYAIDIHENLHVVQQTCKLEGIKAKLFRGSVFDMPFETSFFDVVGCFSILEHIEDLEHALKETHRILRKDGILIVGIPAVNPNMTKLFKLIGYSDIDKEHISSPECLEKIATRFFLIEKVLTYPNLFSKKFYLYKCFKFRKRV